MSGWSVNLTTLFLCKLRFPKRLGGGWVVRWCWVNFQCRGVQLVWIRVGQGPTALAVGAGGGVVWPENIEKNKVLFCSVWTFFSRLSFLFSFSLSLGDCPI